MKSPQIAQLQKAQAMEFGFRHCALESQQQPIVEITRVVNAVAITNQCVE
jgi:hypothetical protein